MLSLLVTVTLGYSLELVESIHRFVPQYKRLTKLQIVVQIG